MKKYIIKLTFCLGVLVLASCSREEKLDAKSVLSTDETNLTALDKYIQREFVKPYNIEVQYKYNDVETDPSYNVTPATTQNSIRMMNLIKYLCLEPYDLNADRLFLKKYFPKQITLIGSGGYNTNGTVVLGTAQGGVKIVLYSLNDMDVNDPSDLVERYFNTIFHEFSHILHQNKAYTTAFNEISGPDYVNDLWSKYWKDNNTTSSKKGFVSDYSSKEVNEDFVEIISRYITSSDSEWQSKLLSAGAEGEQKIVQKLSIVKTYMNESWGIDIDELRNEVQSRLNNLDDIDIDSID